jgi:hypothetical protein
MDTTITLLGIPAFCLWQWRGGGLLMSITNLPAFFDMNYTDKDGKMTNDSYLYNDQTFQVLNLLINMFNGFVQTNTTAESALQAVGINPPALIGVAAPSFTTAQITAIEPFVSNGAIWFNTNLAKLQVKTASGTVQTITST